MSNNQPHPKTDLLWERLMHRYSRDNVTGTELVSVIKLGNNIGLHEEQTRQIVRYWANRGLVETPHGDANTVRLADDGIARLNDFRADD